MIISKFYWIGTLLFFLLLNSCTHIKTGDENMRLKRETILMDSIKKLDSLSDLYWINDDSLSIIYARISLKLTKSLSSSKPLIKAYHTIGKAYYLRNKDSSFYYYSLALSLADRLESKTEKPSLFYNIASLALRYS